MPCTTDSDGQVVLISVEIVYALPQTQTVITLRVPIGTTAAEAILRSDVASIHPEIGRGPPEVSIFGKRVNPATALRDQDQVNICRPLVADPKRVRRRRARLKGGR